MPLGHTKAINGLTHIHYQLCSLSWRLYSTSASSGRVDNVSVVCRSNDFIKLRIHHPLVRSDPTAPIIIYLPPGPVSVSPLTSRPGPDVASALCTASSATVVQINYRLSKEHSFPICVHDVLQGYDWITEHLIPGRAFHRPGRNARHATPIAVCGELVGGGLATMLALTECRTTGPCVSAAAINEPIVDWIFPEGDEFEDDEDAIDFDDDFGVKPVERNHSTRAQKIVPSFRAFGSNGVLDADDLLRARSSYFRKPADYFDPFASPMLFLRSAGMTTPGSPVYSALDEFAELERYEREDFQRQQLKLSTLRNVSEPSSQDHITTDSSEPIRKSYTRWPSTSAGLRIPDLHVGFGDTSPLSDQAVELAMLLRKNLISQNRRDGNKKAASAGVEFDFDREQAFTQAEQKIQIQATEGISFWSAGHSPKIGRVAQWLRSVL